MRAIVGGFQLIDRAVGLLLERYSYHPKFKAVIDVLHDEVTTDKYVARGL